MAQRRKSEITVKDPLLYVEWDDHHANAAWQDKVDHSPSKCASVGWLTKEDRRGLTIAGSVDPNSQSIGSTQYILKRDITYRVVVK